MDMDRGTSRERATTIRHTYVVVLVAYDFSQLPRFLSKSPPNNQRHMELRLEIVYSSES